MRSRAPFSAQLRVFHQNITCSMHTFPSRIESFWIEPPPPPLFSNPGSAPSGKHLLKCSRITECLIMKKITEVGLKVYLQHVRYVSCTCSGRNVVHEIIIVIMIMIMNIKYEDNDPDGHALAQLVYFTLTID